MPFANKITMASFKQAVGKIMSSKLLMFYLGFSLLYCVVQTGLSARAFIDTSGPETKIRALLSTGDALNATIPFVNSTSLALCASTPGDKDFTCHYVWDGTKRENSVNGTLRARGGQFNVQSGVRDSVKLAFEGVEMDLDKSCLWSLNWVHSELGHSKREIIAFLCFQIWVFVISIIGVSADSMPHLFASLATHALVFAWGVFQVVQSLSFQASFKRIITDGACAGAGILPDFFDIRRRTEIPLLVVNFVAFLFSAFLTLKIVKVINWHHFKSVGANLALNRHRKFMLVLFTTIQLSFFFVGVFYALLFDLVFFGNVKTMSSFTALYRVTTTVSLIIIVPWMLTGVYAVEREKKLAMMFFLGYAIIWVTGFATCFFSSSFVMEISHWPFLALMGTMLVILTSLALILGVACRINFGKGYLVGKDISADGPVNPSAKSWGDLESSPHEEKLATMPFASDVPQFPTTFEPPRIPPAAMNVPRLFEPSNFAAPPMKANKVKGVSLADDGISKPRRRDSGDSFGNMDGWRNSPPSSQPSFYSYGSSFAAGPTPSFSAAPRAAPVPPPSLPASAAKIMALTPQRAWSTKE